MSKTVTVSRTMLAWILIFSFVLFGLVVILYCSGILILDHTIIEASKATGGRIIAERLRFLKSRWVMFGLPSFVFLLLCWILMVWAVLRQVTGKRMLLHHAPAPTEFSEGVRAPEAVVEKLVYRTDKQLTYRLYAHLLTVFQREGRLVDFFSEELSDYEDSQIGAAVREIHESCKKALHRHLRIKAVVDLEEGKELTLEKGFDPQAFHLVGNIRGEPPFKGIVRHHGWKITQWEIPDLTGDLKPEIVAPAEIEIV